MCTVRAERTMGPGEQTARSTSWRKLRQGGDEDLARCAVDPTGSRLRSSLGRLRLGTRLLGGSTMELAHLPFANLNLSILMST